jgi:small subunit ribosomal protein S18
MSKQRIKLKVSSRILKKKTRKKNLFASAKQCRFSADPRLVEQIDYKNVNFLRLFLTERGKILPARISGNATRFQRMLANEIKKARIMALLPYCAAHQ